MLQSGSQLPRAQGLSQHVVFSVKIQSSIVQMPLLWVSPLRRRDHGWVDRRGLQPEHQMCLLREENSPQPYMSYH